VLLNTFDSFDAIGDVREINKRAILLLKEINKLEKKRKKNPV
jgi:uncharacterized small protein (DUF1192 family)